MNLQAELEDLKNQVKNFYETFNTSMNNIEIAMKWQNATHNAKLEEKDTCIAFLTAERKALQEDVKRLHSELAKQRNKKPLILRILRL